MIYACGWVSHAWAAGVLLGAFVFGPILTLVAYHFVEEWYTERRLRDYRGGDRA